MTHVPGNNELKINLLTWFNGDLDAAQEAFDLVRPSAGAKAVPATVMPRPNRWLKAERTVGGLQPGGDFEAPAKKRRPYKRKNLAYWAKIDKNKKKK